ncbi:G-protein-coupled receptor family protein [Cavenderia fasciculata]|uniref:G-protein-coupled receptor family protein n=1 Tax=Cavenderia fasciculata TaxID=261658 RepID=F4PYC2_CACFS|nr:G-protein-coupled receptor family protein [Cavenderia fasciculata]EGG19389.1 G-protein-coupled receptor family protein [Cavenderia fasciculata]|eukprot:XP_004357660.1 G-protein-coupled receptor family protein [Cavenderia fasciculata]
MKYQIDNIVVLLVALFATICIIDFPTSNAQYFDPTARCEPYAGYPECRDRLKNPNSVWVSETITQELLYTNLSTMLGSMQFMPPSCANEHTFKLLCNQYFQECVDVVVSVNANISVALFNKQCRDDCIRGLADCPIDKSCADLVPYYNVWEFPEKENTFNLSLVGGNDFTIQCFATDSIITNGGDIPCPPPFYLRNSTDRQADIDAGYMFIQDTRCVLPCPSPFFSQSQWDQLSNMAYVLGTISFITTLFNIFTYGVLNRKYDRHSICIIFMSFSFWLVMLTDVVFLGTGWELNCPEPDRYGRQSDAGCASTGIIFQFGVVSAIMWWSTMSFDLWIVLKKVKNTKSYEKLYIIVINSIALILTLAPLSKQQYGYSIAGLGCWILEDNWLNGVFWGPLSVCLFAGISFIVLILYEVFKIVNRVDTGKKKSMRILKYNLKPFLIILCLFVEFAYMFGYHFYTQENMDKYEKGLEDYIICVVTGGTDCTANTIPFGAHFVFLFFIRLIGIEVMVFYGLNRRAKKIWMQSFVFNNRFFTFSFQSTKSTSGSSKEQNQKQNSVEMKKVSSRTEESDVSDNQNNNNNQNQNNNNNQMTLNVDGATDNL